MKDATTIELLQRLGVSWVVTLTAQASDDQWQLRIASHPARWDECFTYTYRGSLASVVGRAYAGEPDDDGSEQRKTIDHE